MEMEGAWWKAHLRLGEAFMRLERYNDAVQVDTIPHPRFPPPTHFPDSALQNTQASVQECSKAGYRNEAHDKIMCPPHVPPPPLPALPQLPTPAICRACSVAPSRLTPS